MRLSFVTFCCALLCTVLVCMCNVNIVHGLSLQLISDEFPFEQKAALKDNIVANGGAKHCVLLEISDQSSMFSNDHHGNGKPKLFGEQPSLSGGIVRFRYNTNLSSVNLRHPLIVSVHVPDGGTVNVANTKDANAISAVSIFKPSELEALRKRTASAASGAKVDNTIDKDQHNFDLDDDGEGGITVVVRAAKRSETVNSPIIEGNYAVCFGLDRGHRDARRMVFTPVTERVDIDLLDVISTHQNYNNDKSELDGSNTANAKRSTGSYSAKGQNRLAGSGWNQHRRSNEFNTMLADPDSAYAKMIRKIYHAGADADIEDLLLKKKDVLSSQEIGLVSSEVHNTQKMVLQALYTASDIQKRHMRMRQTAESTFTRIWISTLCVMGAMSSMVWFTYRYTKNIIVKRKLI